MTAIDEVPVFKDRQTPVDFPFFVPRWYRSIECRQEPIPRLPREVVDDRLAEWGYCANLRRKAVPCCSECYAVASCLAESRRWLLLRGTHPIRQTVQRNRCGTSEVHSHWQLRCGAYR